jgi:hypothetical protein
MTHTRISAAWIVGLVALSVFLTAIPAAHANPSIFANGVTTGSAASTSPAFMTPGTGTSTTPVYDAQLQTFSGGFTSKTDAAGLLIQFTASSTNSVLSAAVEYSQDGVDWYRNFVIDPTQIGTTTTPFSFNTPFSVKWTFASSTVGGSGAIANNNRSTAALLIPTPFRYTRVVFSLTGANGAVWAQLVPIKEQR